MSLKSQAGLKDQTYIAMTSNIFERSIETYRNKIEKSLSGSGKCDKAFCHYHAQYSTSQSSIVSNRVLSSFTPLYIHVHCTYLVCIL